jgi:hypothetical protein
MYELRTPRAKRLLLLGALCVVGWLSVSGFTGVSAPGRLTVLAIEGAEPMSMQGCKACIWCGTDAHAGGFIENKPELNMYSHDEHGCEPSGDCDSVTLCLAPEPSPEELGQLWVALSTLEGNRLEEVVEAYDFVTYNEERRAFQFTRCGATVGHLPLTDAQVASLTSS